MQPITSSAIRYVRWPSALRSGSAWARWLFGWRRATPESSQKTREERIDLDHRTEIADLAIKRRLPAIYPGLNLSKTGLMSYAVSLNDLSRRAVTYVDKI